MQRVQRLRHERADVLGALDEALALDDLEIFQRGRARRRVPGIRVAGAQEEVLVGFECAQRGGPDEHAAERHVSRSHGLGKAGEVGHDAVVLCGEPTAETSESADDLVEDEERTVLVAQLAQLREVALARREHSTGTLQWLHEHRGDTRTVAAHRHRQCLDVVGVDLRHIWYERVVAHLVERQALGACAAEVGAVVSAAPRDDHRALRLSGLHVGEPREFHRRIDCLGAARAEEHAVALHRRERVQLVGELVGDVGGERVEVVVRLERRHLCGDRVGHLFAAVPDVAVPEARHAVDVFLARVVVKPGALAAHHRDELRARRLGEGVQVGARHDENPSYSGSTSLSWR